MRGPSGVFLNQAECLRMGTRLPARLLAAFSVVLLCASYAGCDGEAQSIYIVAQDYRFTPDRIQVASSQPIHLILFNQGREFHEFESRLLSDPSVVIESTTIAGESTSSSRLRIAPGQRLVLRFRAPAGTYLFSCKVRGHTGMTGTFIVE
jgi:uncharacterized cupredoxin-like copper-binding protein